MRRPLFVPATTSPSTTVHARTTSAGSPGYETVSNVSKTNTWRLDPEIAGSGALIDLGIYPLNALQYLLDRDPVAVQVKLTSNQEAFGQEPRRLGNNGAIALIENPDLQTAGATIATVEVLYASYLNILNADVLFPMAFDEPKTMEEVLAAAGQFIVDQ